jgi:hypothetical protein
VADTQYFVNTHMFKMHSDSRAETFACKRLILKTRRDVRVVSPLSIDVFSTRVPRLHHVSTAGKGWALIQQANRAFKGCWTQVHVPLRRGQIPVAGELLNCPSWSPAHRQMRPETAGSRLETRVAKPGEPVNFRLFPQWLFAQFILFLRSIWILI